MRIFIFRKKFSKMFDNRFQTRIIVGVRRKEKDGKQYDKQDNKTNIKNYQR